MLRRNSRVRLYRRADRRFWPQLRSLPSAAAAAIAAAARKLFHSGPCPFQELPPDILLKIASFLDGHSAQNLARTSKSIHQTLAGRVPLPNLSGFWISVNPGNTSKCPNVGSPALCQITAWLDAKPVEWYILSDCVIIMTGRRSFIRREMTLYEIFERVTRNVFWMDLVITGKDKHRFEFGYQGEAVNADKIVHILSTLPASKRGVARKLESNNDAEQWLSKLYLHEGSNYQGICPIQSAPVRFLLSWQEDPVKFAYDNMNKWFVTDRLVIFPLPQHKYLIGQYDGGFVSAIKRVLEIQKELFIFGQCNAIRAVGFDEGTPLLFQGKYIDCKEVLRTTDNFFAVHVAPVSQESDQMEWRWHTMKNGRFFAR